MCFSLAFENALWMRWLIHVHVQVFVGENAEFELRTTSTFRGEWQLEQCVQTYPLVLTVVSSITGKCNVLSVPAGGTMRLSPTANATQSIAPALAVDINGSLVKDSDGNSTVAGQSVVLGSLDVSSGSLEFRMGVCSRCVQHCWASS